MGVTNFAAFVNVIQPDAVVPVKKSTRATDNAFVRAGQNEQAVVMDGMTHVYTLTASLGWKNKGPKKTDVDPSPKELEMYKVTGADVLQAFYRRIADYFNAYHLCATSPDTSQRPPPVLVMLLDKFKYVNPGKAACQKKRSAGKQEGYGPTVQYFMEGVRPTPTAIMQSIDINKALSARGDGRRALFRFLLAGLVAKPQQFKWPPNSQLYVDTEEGIRLFMGTEAGELYEVHDFSDEEKRPVVDCKRAANQLGESDLAAVRWTALLNRPVRLITTDTDWAMLHVYHIWPRVNKVPGVVWDNNGPIRSFCIAQAITTLRDDYHFTREAIVSLCVLSGCDYFEKSAATHMIGHPILYDGMFALMKACAPRTGKPRPNLHTLDGMREALWHIYATRLQCPPSGQALRLVKRSPGMPLLLDPDSLAEVFVAYKLAMDYFCQFLCWDPRADPQKPGGARLSALDRVQTMQTAFKRVHTK